jgi:hypothetical protein
MACIAHKQPANASMRIVDLANDLGECRGRPGRRSRYPGCRLVRQRYGFCLSMNRWHCQKRKG